MKPFLDDDFLLESKPARRLFHEYAEMMPIFDYHCHLQPAQVEKNHRFENLTRIWLQGDHYKWRAMRANGIGEEYITGPRTDREKFQAWAATVPKTLGNPLFHWTHLELKSPFGIRNKLLSPETADTIYDACTEMLQTNEFRARGIMEKFKVRAICTTDDPTDTLEHHLSLAGKAGINVKMLPTFRPDKAMAVDRGSAFTDYLEMLSRSAGLSIGSFQELAQALDRRHEFFHNAGCRLSDHGLTCPEFVPGSMREVESVFQKALNGENVHPREAGLFRTALLLELGRMNSRRGWVMQLHMGALRNNNSRMFNLLGSDAGFDSMADGLMAEPLARLLDALDAEGKLPRTILYTLNPRDNDLIAAMTGCFQDGTVPAKVQFGSAWWFNDQKEGMISQMTSLANMGLLSRFVGMLTDSRSVLSYPRHEYFRRILANLMGGWMERGEAPGDFALMGGIIQDICFNNAAEYFGIEVKAE